MHIKLYCWINPIPGLEIDKAVTNGSAVYTTPIVENLCFKEAAKKSEGTLFKNAFVF